MSQTDALRRQPVNVGRRQSAIAHGAQVAVAEVVGDQKKNVRWCLGLLILLLKS